jgi:hypothetical protein
VTGGRLARIDRGEDRQAPARAGGQLSTRALLARREDLVELAGEQRRPAQVDVGAVVSRELEASAER